jgi:hypothetical protein
MDWYKITPSPKVSHNPFILEHVLTAIHESGQPLKFLILFDGQELKYFIALNSELANATSNYFTALGYTLEPLQILEEKNQIIVEHFLVTTLQLRSSYVLPIFDLESFSRKRYDSDNIQYISRVSSALASAMIAMNEKCALLIEGERTFSPRVYRTFTNFVNKIELRHLKPSLLTTIHDTLVNKETQPQKKPMITSYEKKIIANVKEKMASRLFKVRITIYTLTYEKLFTIVSQLSKEHQNAFTIKQIKITTKPIKTQTTKETQTTTETKPQATTETKTVAEAESQVASATVATTTQITEEQTSSKELTEKTQTEITKIAQTEQTSTASATQEKTEAMAETKVTTEEKQKTEEKAERTKEEPTDMIDTLLETRKIKPKSLPILYYTLRRLILEDTVTISKNELRIYRTRRTIFQPIAYTSYMLLILLIASQYAPFVSPPPLTNIIIPITLTIAITSTILALIKKPEIKIPYANIGIKELPEVNGIKKDGVIILTTKEKQEETNEEKRKRKLKLINLIAKILTYTEKTEITPLTQPIKENLIFHSKRQPILSTLELIPYILIPPEPENYHITISPTTTKTTEPTIYKLPIRRHTEENNNTQQNQTNTTQKQ